MHDALFADSARQAPVQILRLPMLPYSVGHEVLLLNQRNPLLFEPAFFNQLPPAEQRVAIVRAALVCYRTWKQNHVPERNLRLWGWLIRKADFALEIASWRNYRAAGCTCPPSPSEEDYQIANGKDLESGRSFGGSMLARLIPYLSRHGLYAALGCDTPFDVPFGLANHLYLSELEMEGNVLIENAREAQVKEEMIEHRKAIAAEKERAKCLP